jgi:hypothetical protein
MNPDRTFVGRHRRPAGARECFGSRPDREVDFRRLHRCHFGDRFSSPRIQRHECLAVRSRDVASTDDALQRRSAQELGDLRQHAGICTCFWFNNNWHGISSDYRFDYAVATLTLHGKQIFEAPKSAALVAIFRTCKTGSSRPLPRWNLTQAQCVVQYEGELVLDRLRRLFSQQSVRPQRNVYNRSIKEALSSGLRRTTVVSRRPGDGASRPDQNPARPARRIGSLSPCEGRGEPRCVAGQSAWLRGPP